MTSPTSKDSATHTTARSQHANNVEAGTRECERCGKPFGMTRQWRRFCSEPCRKRAERARRPKRVVVTRAKDNRATFDTARYCGGRIADQDLGAYYSAVRRDPCVYCGDEAAELDHIQPKAEGGHNYWDNRAAICSACNARKGKRSLLNALLVLPIYRHRAELQAELEGVGQW